MPMDGLEAHYALLREVSARGHAVQTRLRTSLPLLWTESALVMNGAARRARTEAKSRPRRLNISSNKLGESKNTSVAGAHDVDRLLGEWSSVGRRRRMEWEVSRRIARVGRELQTKPRGRRYWHKAPEVPGAEAMRALDSVPRIKRASSAVQTDAAALLRSRRSPQFKRANMAMSGGHYMLPTASWKANTTALDGTELPPLKLDVVKRKQNCLDDDVFNGLGDFADVSRKADRRPESPPSREDSAASQPTSPNADPIAGSRRDMSSALLLSPCLSVKDAEDMRVPSEPMSEQLLEPTSDQDMIITPVNADEGKSSLDNELLSPRRRADSKGNQAIGPMNARPSSIGRQVLSDYRTMPSVASFGPGPAVSGLVAAFARGRACASTQLNADVLRRLFNDLDFDRDGHINRIETCLALHRLQIAVPAAKIASFFRNVYTSSGSGKTSYRPLHEVINYKQFVAFVTAAFDQQKQAAEAEAVAARRARSERPKQLKWREVAETDSQRLFPSVALPMLQKRSDTSTSTHLKAEAYPTRTPDRETLRYQVEDVEPPAVTSSIELTNRIVNDIPDVLVGRVLADAAHEAEAAAAELGRGDAKALVRESLEGLPRAVDPAHDDKITTQIVQELIQEHLRANLSGGLEGESSGDLTGLRRAAAFFERQPQGNDASSYTIEEDANADQSLGDWLGIVTVEQVSALIHEVWRENENNIAVNLSIAAASDPGEESDQVDQPPDKPLEASDIVIQTSPDHVGMIAEKAVQVGDDDDAHETERSGPKPDSQTRDARPIRTHLGRLVLAVVPEGQAPATTVADTLHQLRRLRLYQRAERHRRSLTRSRHTVSPHEQRESVGREHQDEDERSSCRSLASHELKSPCDSFAGITQDKENNGPPPNAADEASDTHAGLEKMVPEPIDDEQHYAEVVSLEEKHLQSFELPIRESWSSSDARNSRSSRDSSSSSNATSGDVASSSAEGCHISNAVDRRVRRINAQRMHIQPPNHHCWSNADLSEGEIDPNDPGNISEGEITGRRREKHARAANTASRRVLQRVSHHNSSSEGLYSSAESGEIRSHVISSFSSSRESGELPKVRPLLPHRNAS